MQGPLRPRLLLALSALLALGTSCASSAGDGRLRVELLDYQSGQHLVLASESDTDRLTYYSTKRDDASLKIQTDEVMEALVDELMDLGYDRHAEGGGAPSRGGATITRGLELHRGDEVTHWLTGPGTAIEERKAFLECLSTFVQLYNITQSFQAIENDEGAAVFQEPTRPGAPRP